MVSDFPRIEARSWVVSVPIASAPQVPARISIVSPLCAARSASASVAYCVVPICATAVAAGSVVPSNTKAILYLGTLKPDKQVTVPDLHGMTLSAARNTLQGLGLYVHVSGGVSDGSQTVTKQDFAAQSTVAYGTVVTVETADMAQRAQ